MLLTNCLLNLTLTWTANCVISYNAVADQETTFAIIDTKLYVLVLTLSTPDNSKLLRQLKSTFKRIIFWNKYQSNILTQTPSQYLDYLIDSSFHGVNRLPVLSFESNAHQISHKRYFLSTVEIKDYNVLLDG